MRAASWRMDFERGSREACWWADAVVQTRDEDGEEGQWGESGRHSDCTLERQQSFGKETTRVNSGEADRNKLQPITKPGLCQPHHVTCLEFSITVSFLFSGYIS